MAEQDLVADAGASKADAAEVAKQPVDQNASANGASQASSPTGSRKQSKPKHDDLSNHPQFRALQSQMQAKVAKLEQALEQAQTRDMTDAERREFFRSKEGERLQQQAETLANQQMEIDRTRQLIMVSQKYGIPYDVVDQAQNPLHLTEIVADYLAQSAQQQAKTLAQAKEEKAKANSVDLGGGDARTPEDDWDAEYRKAKETGNTAQLFSLARKRGK